LAFCFYGFSFWWTSRYFKFIASFKAN
jgi:hypothetical protein